MEPGKMSLTRNSRLRGLFYFASLIFMIGMLMVLQKTSEAEAHLALSPPEGATAGNVTRVDDAASEHHVEGEPTPQLEPEPTREVTSQELAEEVYDLLESVEDRLRNRTETESSLHTFMDYEYEEPDDEEQPADDDETGDDGDSLTLTERFKDSTVTFDEIRENLSSDAVVRLQALELQSILGDCDETEHSGELFKSDFEQRAEDMEPEEGSELQLLWCSLKGNPKRDTMRVYVRRIQTLHAPDEELDQIVQMENDYDEYLDQLEQKEEARIIEEMSEEKNSYP